jgi:MFS superfamily sulfate permease-like transporter
MKKNDSLFVVLRTALGLFLILYALNRFFHFLPSSYGAMPEVTENFLDAVAAYLPALYIFEILIGLILIFNKWTAFILIVLAPLSVAFLIFSISNGEFSKAWPAFVVAILNAVLLLRRREAYKPLFK